MTNLVKLLDLSSLARSSWQVCPDDPIAAFDGTLAAVSRASDGEPFGTAICCDGKGNWRKALSPEYKAQREAAPAGYYKMLDRVKRYLVAAGFVLWEVDGYEADDIIATATACAVEHDHRVRIASADKDLLQLVSERVRCMRTAPLDWSEWGPDEVKAATGVRPDQMHMLLSLMGDSSDNVMGCPGVGKKTAAEIVNQVSGWDDLWAKAADGPGLMPNKGGVRSKIGAALLESRAGVELAAELVRLDSLVPLPTPFESIFTRRQPTAPAPEPDIFEETPTMTTTPTAELATQGGPLAHQGIAHQGTKVSPPPQPAASAPGGRLAGVVSGVAVKPLRAMVYGPEGSGKTTLAVSAPDSILFDADDGSSLLPVARYPFRDATDTDPGTKPLEFSEVLDGIKELATQPHPYRTLVIDTVDALERLIWEHVCSAKGVDGIEDLGYGKGYVAALDEWARLLAFLERLQEKTKMGVVLVGHSHVKVFRNPNGEDFDRYQIKLNEKASSLLREWVNLLGFLSYEDVYVKESAKAKAKAKSTGARVLSTARTGAYDAKSRYRGMPDEIIIDEASPWSSISPHLKGNTP